MATKTNKSKAIREFKSSGNKAMGSGAFAKAARQYTKALELDPGSAILYSNRSAAHFNLRQFTESLEDAESAILCDSVWWKAYKRKGLSLIHMQRYEEAIAALEEGLKIVKKNAEMEKNLEFAKACQEQAQNLYILPEPHMMQRLESVPVFIVTDDVGQPFFITYEDGQQVCTFYFDKEDATSTLDWIKAENPDLGDTARVIHITLNQAFNLAQETQKQYYEETTRAAVEEDRKSALQESNGTGDIDTPLVADVDGSDDEKDEATKSTDAPAEEKAAETKDVVTEKEAAKDDADKTDKEKEAGNNFDDGAIDDNAPLSFQFRPELRQVQVAVELLNKHPNPPVRPILRDPPSVRKAKLEAAAAAAAAEGENTENTNGEKEDEAKKESSEKSVDKMETEKPDDAPAEKEEAKEDVQMKDGEESKDEKKPVGEEDDEELTVDNFNGIPIFQAKGLTLLQNNEQLIPLFFSKWDLEAAWKQLMTANSPTTTDANGNTISTSADDVPKECEVDVGTLEDVLRRMSESKTKEFESVFFVPSRESMKAIGAKFPLDDLTAAKPIQKPVVRKATFSKAKQIAANGGSKDEVRAAIKEDLELAKERQRMAEIIAQIEQARRLNGNNSTASTRRSGRVDRTMRRNAQRLAQKQAAKNANRPTPNTSTTTAGTGIATPSTTATNTSATTATAVTADKTNEEKKTEVPATETMNVASANPAVTAAD